MRPLLLVAAVIVLAGFESPAGAAACARMDPAIDRLQRDWNSAVARADVDSLLSLLEPDFVVVPTNGAPIATRASLERTLWATFGRARVNASFACESRWRQGNLVVERGWETQTLKPHDGSMRHTSGRPVLVTMRKGADGNWRFAWRMFDPAR